MKILAMDTAFSRGGAGLYEDGRMVGEAVFEGSQAHVAWLPLQTDRLLQAAGWRLGDLDRIAVTLGPGSFSGVRIALGMAKGLSLVLGVPVVGLSTLEVVAAGAGESGWIAAVLDARRQEVYAGLFRIDHEGVVQDRALCDVWDPDRFVAALSDWMARSGQPVLLTGHGLAVHAGRFDGLSGDACRWAEAHRWSLEISCLAGLAAGVPASACSPVEALEPSYWRRADVREPGGGT